MKSLEESGASCLYTESNIPMDAPHDSRDSSPRWGSGTISLSDDQIGSKSEDSTVSRVKFLCSFGGKICPRPHDNQLRYVMGETKIVVVNRNIAYAELMAKLTKLAGRSVTLKYQLPHEDLDALVSVVSDEDLQNMFEEYEKAESRKFSCRPRLFLFPIKGQEDGVELFTCSKNWEQEQFTVATNPTQILSNKREVHAHPTAEAPDFLFGLDGASEALLNRSTSFEGAKAGGLHHADYLAPQVLQVPLAVSVPFHPRVEHSTGQSYELPLEQMSYSKSQFTRQLSREEAQENCYPMVSPNSPRSNVPFSDVLHGSEPDKHATTTSEMLPSLSQRDLMDHRSTCSSSLAHCGVDAGILSKKALMDSVAEASLWIDHGRDFKLVPRLLDTQLGYREELTPASQNLQPNSQQQCFALRRLGRTSMPLHEYYNLTTPKALGESLQELQQKSKILQQETVPATDVSRRAEIDRSALNDANYWKLLANCRHENKEMNILKHEEEHAPVHDVGRVTLDAHEERVPSERLQKLYIPEESSGLLWWQGEPGDQASSLLQQRVLHSSSPSVVCDEKYWKKYQHPERTDSFCEICASCCCAEFAVKGLLPPYPTPVAAPSIHHAPSPLGSLQTGVSGDFCCTRQVSSPIPQRIHYFKHIPPAEATCNFHLSRSSCLCNDQPASPRRACSPSRFNPNLLSRFYNVQAKDNMALPSHIVACGKPIPDEIMIYNPDLAQLRAEQTQTRNVIAGNLPNDFSCSRDFIRQSKDVHEIISTKANAIYNGVTS